MLRRMLQVFWGLFLCAQVIPAQVTTATILGVVQDESGAVVPGATVTAKNLETGGTRTVNTNNQGRYQVPNLAPGVYEVEAKSSGFQTEIRRGITLTVGREANLPFTLRVGEVTQQVVVTGEAPLVDTSSSAVGGTVEPDQVQALPLNTRSLEQLALLQPGVVLGRNSSSIGSLSRGRGRRITIHGSRPYQNNYMMDGTDINSYSNEAPASVSGNFMGVDAIREFRVESSSYGAQYGRNAGGAINIVTKSGTNRFHGSVFEFLRNDNLDTATWEANAFASGAKPEFRRNQFGFSLGGPIKRDKTFFFGNYEGLREALGRTIISKVPSLDARRGFVPSRTGGLEFVVIDPAFKPFLELFPLPNGIDFGDGSARRSDPFSQPASENLYSGRVDHNFAESDSVFARYTETPGERTVVNDLVIIPFAETSNNRFLTVEESHTFSPVLLNTFRFGFSRTFADQVLAPAVDVSHLPEMVPGKKPFIDGGTRISTGVFSQMGDTTSPTSFATSTAQWSDDAFYMQGRHTLKFGGILLRFRSSQTRGDSTAGDVSFVGDVSVVLRGIVDQFGAPDPKTSRARRTRQKLFGWYVQDDVQLLPNLMLNLGLRHEFVTDPSEADGQISNLVSLFDNELTVGSILHTEKALFAPRFGFAWDPFRTGKTSIRGGFGVFYDQPLLNRVSTPISSNPPFSVQLRIGNVPFGEMAERLFAGGASPLIELRPVTFQGTTTVMKYDFSIQRDLGLGTALMVGYSGSLGRNLPRRSDENSVIPTIRPDGTKFFPRNGPVFNPKWESVRRLTYDTNSSYNAFLLSLRKRISEGVQFQVSYTLAKSLDAGVGVEGTEANNSRFQSMDPYDWKRDWSVSEFHARHNLVANFGYELPFGHNKPLLNQVSSVVDKIVGGWQINGILTLTSGAYVEVLNSHRQADSGTRATHDRPDVVPGGNNNPIEGAAGSCAAALGKAGQKLGTPRLWFDPCQFQLQERGTWGNLGRNTVLGPGAATFDFSLFKNILIPGISEEFSLQFRAEFFNLLNRPNFATPDGTVFTNTAGAYNGRVGSIETTATTSRQIQFGLRVQF